MDKNSNIIKELYKIIHKKQKAIAEQQKEVKQLKELLMDLKYGNYKGE